ncbi:MAG: hypothetical protein GMKNLPBB_00259 [Myxococcota bacterium]|nr:hypothetical protein [Myxococcota bacterium]
MTPPDFTNKWSCPGWIKSLTLAIGLFLPGAADAAGVDFSVSKFVLRPNAGAAFDTSGGFNCCGGVLLGADLDFGGGKGFQLEGAADFIIGSELPFFMDGMFGVRYTLLNLPAPITLWGRANGGLYGGVRDFFITSDGFFGAIVRLGMGGDYWFSSRFAAGISVDGRFMSEFTHDAKIRANIAATAGVTLLL